MKQAPTGLRTNLGQFLLLVLVNAFVGGMIGMERSMLPQLAGAEFGLAARSAALSFIIAFGLVKAVANLLTGPLAKRWGRKRLLIIGWLFGLPVPFLLMFAPSWSWVIAANLLLGANQGFAWSATVIMKIDLVGERERGLAMGLNEFAGYLAVALAALLSGWLAGRYGLRPYPFYLGVGFSIIGLLISVFWVRDTYSHVLAEAASSPVQRLQNIFLDTSWRHRNLGSVTLTGMVNNLNDGMVWGLLPLLLTQKSFSLAAIGVLAAIYPAVWGTGQILTGRLSDFICKKDLLLWGMLLQATALIGLSLVVSFSGFAVCLGLLGIGTALVYPTFLASIADNTHPLDRAHSLGIFRFWRDLGYAVGALLCGLLADAFGISVSIAIVGLLTASAGIGANLRMRCRTNHPALWIWFKEKLLVKHG